MKLSVLKTSLGTPAKLARVNRSLSCLAISLTLLSLSACSTLKRNSSNPTRAQYLQNAWVAPDVKGCAPSQLYSEVYFSPVITSHLKAMGWWAQQSVKTQSDLERDTQRLGVKMRQDFVRAVARHPENRFRVVSDPGPHTLIVDLAITELVPTKAFWNAAATGAGIEVPGAGLLTSLGKGSITIQGRARDGATGRTLALFQHRAKDPSALVNVSKLTWYRGSEANITDLARKTADFLNAPSHVVVKRSLPYNLLAF
jgi:hypothetical protein